MPKTDRSEKRAKYLATMERISEKLKKLDEVEKREKKRNAERLQREIGALAIKAGITSTDSMKKFMEEAQKVQKLREYFVQGVVEQGASEKGD